MMLVWIVSRSTDTHITQCLKPLLYIHKLFLQPKQKATHNFLLPLATYQASCCLQKKKERNFVFNNTIVFKLPCVWLVLYFSYVACAIYIYAHPLMCILKAIQSYLCANNFSLIALRVCFQCIYCISCKCCMPLLFMASKRLTTNACAIYLQQILLSS